MALNILLIDDDALALDAIALTLRDAGHDVRAASDWPGAAKHVRTRLPDLAIADLQAPGAQDALLVSLLRAVAPALPVLAISGGGDGAFAAAKAAGADAALRKPFDWPALEQAIHAALSKHL